MVRPLENNLIDESNPFYDLVPEKNRVPRSSNPFLDSNFTNQNTTPTEVKKPSLFSRIGSAIKNRGSNLNQIQSEAQNISDSGTNPIGKGFQLLGKGTEATAQAFGGVGDVGAEVLKSIATHFRTPEQAQKEQIESGTFDPRTQHMPGVPQGIKTVAHGATEAIQNKLNQWATQHPEAAKNLVAALKPVSATGEIAGTIAAADVGSMGLNKVPVLGEEASIPGLVKAKNAVTEGINTLDTSLGKIRGPVPTSEEKALQKTMEIVKQPLSKSEQATAISQGRGSEKGLLGRTVIEASPLDKRVAEAAHGIVKGKPFEDINALQKEINSSVAKVREGISKSDAIWNKNELKNQISKIEKPITLKSDATLNRTADNFNKAVFQLAQDADKKAVGLLDLRQDFDALVKKEFPRLYDKEMTPMRQYVQDLRTRLNEFAESKLPEGKLPDGTLYSKELKRQSLLIRAIENISEKAPEEGTNAIINWIKRNPKKSIVGGTIGTAALGAGTTKVVHAAIQ